MFLYCKEDPQFNILVDVFISSSTVVGVIFHAVVITGYTILMFTEVSCIIEPALVYYFHSLGVVAVLSMAAIGLFLLTSHYPHETMPTYKVPVKRDIMRSISDEQDAASVTSSALRRRRISTISGSMYAIWGQSSPELESTQWAHEMEIYLIHSAFSVLFLLHLANLIFGSVLTVPLFFSLKIHLGNVIDDQDVAVCSPPLFWFACLTLVAEYLIWAVFLSSFFVIVTKEVKRFKHELDRSYQD